MEVLTINIPPFYEQLLCAPGVATLSALGKDGSIQSTLVWPDYDGEFVKLNMLVGSPKELSIRRGKIATLLRANPNDENQYISLRCELHKITAAGAIEHLDAITRRNKDVPAWYGHIEADDSPSKRRRVVVYLRPVRVYHPQ